jgi:hypothetical protein
MRALSLRFSNDREGLESRVDEMQIDAIHLIF